jgi:3'-5' exonuclease
MSTLVVSLETVSQSWDNLSPLTKTSLTKWFETKNLSALETERELNFIKSGLGLSPFTGSIVSLAMFDVERNLSAVYFCSDTNHSAQELDNSIFKIRTEREMLEDFWEGAKSYDIFVSFNGRAFTLPYIQHRSAILKIKSTVEIAKERYVTKQSFPHHVDLLDEFSFYGAMSKRPSLAILCDAYGIDLPRLAGEDTAELFLQKKFRRIAEKNEAKVAAIKNLYEIWRQYHAPLSFINTID